MRYDSLRKPRVAIIQRLISLKTKKCVFQSILEATSLQELPSLPPSIPRSTRQPAHLHPRIPNLPNRRQEGVPGNACPVRQFNTTSTFTSISAIHQAVLSQLANRLDTLPMATFRRHHRHAEDAGRHAGSSCDWSARGLRQRRTLPREDHDRVQRRPLRQPPLTAHCGNWEGGLTHEKLFHVCPAGEGNGGVKASTLDSRNLLSPKDSFLDLLISSIRCEHVQEAFERLLHELSIFL